MFQDKYLCHKPAPVPVLILPACRDQQEVLPDQVDLEVAPQQDLGQGGDSQPQQQGGGGRLLHQGGGSLPLQVVGGVQTEQLDEGILVTVVNSELFPGLVEIKNFRLVCTSLSPWKTTLHLSK